MVGAGPVAALLSLRQTDITNACAINRASPKGMLNTTPTLTTRAGLRARLTDEMGRMFAIADLRHRAAACATDRSMNNTIDLINIKRDRQRRHCNRDRPLHMHLEGITMQRTKDRNSVE